MEASAEQARQEGEIRVQQSRIQEESRQQTILAELEREKIFAQKAVIEAERANELARVEAERARNSVAALREQLIQARAELATAIQWPATATVEAAGVLDEPARPFRLDELVASASRRPLVRFLDLRERAAQSRLRLERSLAYARERKQFGVPIGSFQAVSHKLVDMKLRLETSRLLLYRLAALIDDGKPTGLESALVKLHLSDSFVKTSLDALQIHGGYGYMTEYEFERDVRDAVGSKLYSGTSELQYEIVAKNLGL